MSNYRYTQSMLDQSEVRRDYIHGDLYDTGYSVCLPKTYERSSAFVDRIERVTPRDNELFETKPSSVFHVLAGSLRFQC